MMRQPSRHCRGSKNVTDRRLLLPGLPHLATALERDALMLHRPGPVTLTGERKCQV
jgi:hypothetical protein